MFKIDWSLGYKRPRLKWTLRGETTIGENFDDPVEGIFAALKTNHERVKARAVAVAPSLAGVEPVVSNSASCDIGSIVDTYSVSTKDGEVHAVRSGRTVFPSHSAQRGVVNSRSKVGASILFGSGHASVVASVSHQSLDGSYVHIGRATVRRLAKLQIKWWNIRTRMATAWGMSDGYITHVSRVTAMRDLNVPWSVDKKTRRLLVYETTTDVSGFIALTALSKAVDICQTLTKINVSHSSIFPRQYVDPPLTHVTKSTNAKVNLIKPVSVPNNEDGVTSFAILSLEYRYGAAVCDIIRFLDEHSIKWFYSKATGLMLTSEEDKTLAIVSCPIVHELHAEVYQGA